MAIPRSRPLPPHLSPLIEKVRLRELRGPGPESSPAGIVPSAHKEAPAATPQQPSVPPRPTHPLLERAVDIEAMASVLLSALEQEEGQGSRHHTRIAKHIVLLAQSLHRELSGLLEPPPSEDVAPQSSAKAETGLP